MNEEGPKSGARSLQDRWKGRLAREWFDAPEGLSSGHWHLFCAHTQKGQSLAELQALNATTYPTAEALRNVLAAVEARLVAGNPGAEATVAGGFGEPEAAVSPAVRPAREPAGGGKD